MQQQKRLGLIKIVKTLKSFKSSLGFLILLVGLETSIVIAFSSLEFFSVPPFWMPSLHPLFLFILGWLIFFGGLILIFISFVLEFFVYKVHKKSLRNGEKFFKISNYISLILVVLVIVSASVSFYVDCQYEKTLKEEFLGLNRVELQEKLEKECETGSFDHSLDMNSKTWKWGWQKKSNKHDKKHGRRKYEFIFEEDEVQEIKIKRYYLYEV